jgi:hypothetical protein
MPATQIAARWNTRRRETSHTQTLSQEGQMTDACEHWLVQRRVNERYWACVDCELEFRPIEAQKAQSAVVREALLRLGLGEA